MAAQTARAQAFNAAAWAAARAAEDPTAYADPDPRAWPRFAATFRGFHALDRFAPRGPLLLALVPLDHDWQLPLAFVFGGWNDCPEPLVHAALWRRWGQAFGAEPFALGWDTADLVAVRPPADRQAALGLAREHYAYCGDLVDQGVGSLAALAAVLTGATEWAFWWD